MILITLKKLQTEGVLSIGDTLNNSETGDHGLINVLVDGRVRVKDCAGDYHIWDIDFGPGARLVERSDKGVQK